MLTSVANDAPNYGKIAPVAPEGDIDLHALFFEDKGPLELELGFGRGNFLLERARSSAAPRIVGIEIKPKWAFKVQERVQRQKLSNVVVWSADARWVLPRIRAAAVLDRVFIHFPDPWWKKRHGKRRLITYALLDEVARLLRAHGELFIQTDVEERAQTLEELLEAHPQFTFSPHGGRLESNPYEARSNREIRAVTDGLPVYRLLAFKIA